MPRYKGRASPKEIERDFPHMVEMRVPLGGFGSKLNAMHRWHEARGIRAIQYRRKPARCQRTSASGRMTVMTFRTDGNHRYSWIKNKRSLFVNLTRLCTIRRNTTTWCRSAAFSASSRLFDLNGETKTVKTKHSSAIIVR
jgi:hypothetical protein